MRGKVNPMSPKEISELLRLKDWSQAELGRQLGVHESAVSFWVHGERTPGGSSRKFMREWLEAARLENRKQPA